MKKANLLLTAAVFFAFAVVSCKKGTTVKPVVGALGSNYPEVLNNIVTPALIDTFRSHGMVINDGTTPPVINGTFLLSPNYCTYDNSAPDAGAAYIGYNYQFSNESTTNYTLMLSYTENITNGSDSGSEGAATYISGNSSLFTVFAQVTGTLSGVTYKELQILSGQLATGGIKNFQFGLRLLSKTSDPGDKVVVPVGTLRIFKDEDGFSEMQGENVLNSVGQTSIRSTNLKEFKSLAASSIKNN